MEGWLTLLEGAARATPPLLEALKAIATRDPRAQRVHDLLEEHGASERAADTLRTGEAPP